jgi:hypothetical protein
MGVFKHQSKGRNIYYAGFGVRGQYFVRSLGTSNRREAERKEKKLRALAEAGRLPLKVSEDDRVKAIRKSLAIPIVSRIHRASARAAAKKRKESPEKRKAWIAAIKAGQDVPEVKALMVKANQETAANPISKKRKRRSLKKMWKRRGHTSRVSEGVRKANATVEVKERRRVGRERWAKKLLGIDVTANAPSGGAKKPRKHGPDPMPFEKRTSFLIGSQVENQIAMSGDRSRRSVVAARYAVAASRNLGYETVKEYHNKLLDWQRRSAS